MKPTATLGMKRENEEPKTRGNAHIHGSDAFLNKYMGVWSQFLRHVGVNTTTYLYGRYSSGVEVMQHVGNLSSQKMTLTRPAKSSDPFVNVWAGKRRYVPELNNNWRQLGKSCVKRVVLQLPRDSVLNTSCQY